MTRALNAGAICFALVFAAGFLLGIVRTLWLVPPLGVRMSGLLEMPVMLVVIIVAARAVVRRMAMPPTPAARLGMGLSALALLLAAELMVVVWLQGRSVAEYFASRDPVSGSVYAVVLGVFAVMPLLVVRR